MRNKSKDVHININIENNLMSKNKQVEQPNTSNIQKPAQKPQITHGGYHLYNPDLPREVNDFYGIMAAKQMHKLSGRNQPLNLSNVLPQIPQTVQPADTPPADTPVYTPMENSENGEEDVEDVPADEDVFESSFVNQPAEVEPENSYNFEPSGSIETIELNHEKYSVFNDEQEEEYNNILYDKNKTKFNTRKNIVKRLQQNQSYKPQLNSILEKNLLGVLKKYRRDLYNKIIDGIYY